MKGVAVALARLTPSAECWWIEPDALNLPPWAITEIINNEPSEDI